MSRKRKPVGQTFASDLPKIRDWMADEVVEVSRRDGWALGAAARALEVEPDLMIEWHGGA